ncbi:lipopolysaccharide biosynthesis protein [Odoribacter lunatus]|uniref:lipopolysaccharide biosynthesis protein n=1 Tax=Odoribacter lunatus TaxID=2941335 RepID=UPI00203C8D4A|nr:lipopolysaccharide biosynthesis protein [Odoribacter lunatus]
MSSSLKQKTIVGIFWSCIERFSVQGIQFVIMIVMARLLLPSDYGMIGMLAIFIAVSQTIIDSGFSNALIRKTDRSETDYSTVFYFNIVVGLLLYGVLFLSAPLIAAFYDTPQLTVLTRVIGLNLFFNSLAVVQRAILTIKVDFKTQAKASFGAAVLSGGVGIAMAYAGFGVWALVMQTILNGLMNTILLWIYSKWKPLRSFSWRSFRELFAFGSKLLVSGLLDTVFKNIYTIVIGKKFASTDLGYYTRADQFAQFPSSNLTGILQRVTFPILSEIQHDKERLASAYRKFLRLSAYVIFPLMTGLAALSYPVINCFLTEKWNIAAVLLQILCFSYMWYPVHAINLNLLQVEGRSDLFLKLEIYKKVLSVCVLVVTIPLGLMAMCWGTIVSSLLALVINTYYTGKLIHIGLFKQIKDLAPSLFYSLSMAGVVWCFIRFFEHQLVQLTGGVIIGIVYYFLISFLTKSRDLKEVCLLLRRK